MKTIELFAGAGGMSAGLIKAGCDIVRAYEIEPAAADVYRRNVGDHIVLADLSNVLLHGTAMRELAPRLVAAGPPCQDFSAAGEGVEGERALLTVAAALLIAASRPEWIIIENVPRALKAKAFREMTDMLREQGYGLTVVVLDAADYGCAQHRKRLFVIGRLEEANGFLLSALAQARQPRVSVRNALGAEQFPELLYMHPRFMHKRALWPTDGQVGTIRSSSRRAMPARFDPGVPVAILDHEMTSILQGFQKGWDWSGILVKDLDVAIGNAVPPPLAEAVARCVLARDRGETVPALEGRFLQWLRRKKGIKGQRTRNVSWRIGKARRLLGGRTYADAYREIGALEAATGFAELGIGGRSELRRALALHREWSAEQATRRELPAFGVQRDHRDDSMRRETGDRGEGRAGTSEKAAA